MTFKYLFSGIAIGLQDNSAQLISIFIAVIVHKAVMAFSLGLNIAQSDLSLKSFILSNVMFSIASPIGVGIGIGMADLPSSLPHDICNGILQGNNNSYKVDIDNNIIDSDRCCRRNIPLHNIL